jgi:hypothetical protein
VSKTVPSTLRVAKPFQKMAAGSSHRPVRGHRVRTLMTSSKKDWAIFNVSKVPKSQFVCTAGWANVDRHSTGHGLNVAVLGFQRRLAPISTFRRKVLFEEFPVGRDKTDTSKNRA